MSTAQERIAQITALEEKHWVRLGTSKWFRLLDSVDAPKDFAPADPTSDRVTRWVPIWVKAICEYGPGWTGNGELIRYVAQQDDEFRLALTAQCVAHPEGVVGFIRDTVTFADEENEWVGEGAESGEDDDHVE